ncbi:MAG TPA: C40 family peptidase, partial [Candidatus Bilophila faecipullorum]|nr:C40 family peptidase [Candidatus Bilophila faecipullorum]
MNVSTIKISVLWLLVGSVLFLSGCASRKAAEDTFALDSLMENMVADRVAMTPEERFAYDYRTAERASSDEVSLPLPNLYLVEKAKTALGTPYVRGGTSRNGFDCSGFVQWTYKSAGVQLPRTAREQSVLGTPIDADEMVAGDIVAFRHPRRGYHTGIYLGDGKFIHSPRRGKSVEITSLSDPYFSSTFLGARRVDLSESEAQAARKLMALYESRASRQAVAEASAPAKRVTSAKAASSKKMVASKSKGKKTTLAKRPSSKKKQAVTAQGKSRQRSVAAKSSKSVQKKAVSATKQTQRKASAPKRTSKSVA